MGNKTRTLALQFIFGTLIGSTLPEFGNLAAIALNLGDEKAHIFNSLFLALGIIGTCLALCIGYTKYRRNLWLVRRKND